MSNRSFVIIDDDEDRRVEVYRCVAKQGTAIPVNSVSELGHFWPDSVWFLVHDDNRRIRELNAAFGARGCYHPIIAYKADLVPNQIVTAIHAGAVSYLVWPFGPADVEQAIARTSDVAIKKGQQAAARVTAQSRISALSAREHQVVEGACSGLTNKEIAQQLSISPRTVEIHRSNALSKLGARNTAHATRMLMQADEIHSAALCA